MGKRAKKKMTRKVFLMLRGEGMNPKSVPLQSLYYYAKIGSVGDLFVDDLIGDYWKGLITNSYHHYY